ncbi:MAG: nuclear transport factor 2 family protein, partial [bacterium]
MLKTKNADGVAALYYSTKPGFSFLPTVSPLHTKDLEGTKAYFVEFVKKNPDGFVTDESVQQLTPMSDASAAYLHSGLYTFELGDIGAQSPVQARFSYVWKKYGNDWKITHHHSSLAPIAARRSGEAAAELTADDTAAEETAALVAKAAEAAPSPPSRRLLTTPEDAATNFKKWVDALKTK